MWNPTWRQQSCQTKSLLSISLTGTCASLLFVVSRTLLTVFLLSAMCSDEIRMEKTQTSNPIGTPHWFGKYLWNEVQWLMKCVLCCV